MPDFSGLTTYGLEAYEREMSTLPTLPVSMTPFTFSFYYISMMRY